jgi:hypothetical protein
VNKMTNARLLATNGVRVLMFLRGERRFLSGADKPSGDYD